MFFKFILTGFIIFIVLAVAALFIRGKVGIRLIVSGIVVFILSLFGGLFFSGQEKIEGALNWEIDEFSFTDHNGNEFGTKDLEGKIWIADFVFTNCTTICPSMTFNMSRLQDMVKEEGIDNVEFVSFSVDPEIDTPELLKKYGEQFNVDFDNFHFLTGYDQAFIESFAYENFKQLVKKPEDDDQVIHQSYFYLVDEKGLVKKSYSGTELPFEEVIEDIKKLQ